MSKPNIDHPSHAAITPEMEPYPAPAVGWYATFVLALMFWMAVLDRFIIALLVDSIQKDLGITDTQFGLIQGFGFSFSFIVFGLLFGALADRKNRQKLIFIGVAFWSVTSAACGLAQNFWHMLIARAGVGAGEASLNPCATSMISDLFPRERRTSAMAVYGMGASLGGGTSLIIGGAIIAWVATLGEVALPVIGPVADWQLVFFIVGLSSIPVALLIFTFPEPVRRGRDKTLGTKRSWHSAYTDLLTFIKGHPRFFICHHAGFVISTVAATGTTAWYPVHMMRVHGWSAGEVGLALGITILSAGIIGKLLCGLLVDAMYRRGYRDAQLRWFAGCLTLAVPTGLIATTSLNPWVFLVLIGLFNVMVTSMPTCSMTALSLVTPNQLRGTSVAVFTTLTGLVGGTVGAILIPFVSDQFFEGPRAIGFAMGTIITIFAPLGALILALGFKPMRLAMEEVEKN